MLHFGKHQTKQICCVCNRKFSESNIKVESDISNVSFVSFKACHVCPTCIQSGRFREYIKQTAMQLNAQN